MELKIKKMAKQKIKKTGEELFLEYWNRAKSAEK